jgi:ribosomal protein S18 acetylase RimI-like enzyme
VLDSEPPDVAEFPLLELRPSRPEDLDRVSDLIEEGFGHPARPGSDPAFTYVVTLQGAVIGTVRLISAEDPAYVAGFVISATHRGRGYGRDVLRRSVLTLRAQGADRVGLDVLTDNEAALALYTSLGFEPVAIEDYYRLPTG